MELGSLLTWILGWSLRVWGPCRAFEAGPRRRRARTRSLVSRACGYTLPSQCSSRLPLFSPSWSLVSRSMRAPAGVLGGLGSDGSRLTPRGECAELSPDELKRQLRPGLRILVAFAEDPGFYHERIIGGEVFPGDYVIATCDGDEYVEKSSWWSSAWLLSGARRYPKELRGEVLPFEVPWTDAEMITFVKRMREVVLTTRAAQPTRRAGRDFSQCYSWEGESLAVPPRGAFADVHRRFAGKQAGLPAKPVLPIRIPAHNADKDDKIPDSPPLAPPKDPPPGAFTPGGYDPADALDPGPDHEWVVCEVRDAPLENDFMGGPSDPQLGRTIKLAPGSLLFNDRALGQAADGSVVCARRMAVVDIPGFVRKCRDKLLAMDPLPSPAGATGGLDGPSVPPARDLRERLGFGKDEPPPAGPHDGVAIDEDVSGKGDGAPDFRVLPVDYDDQGVRYKAFRAAVSESRDGSKYKDWPFQTDGVALNMMKHFERHGGNPLLWLDKWLMTKGIEASERTAIELSVYMRTLIFLTTYDQVNVPALAGAENILLRVAQVVEAYRSDPRRPNWASVKHIAAIDDAFDPVPTSLRSYNAKLTKEEVEAENLRLRMRGLKPTGGEDDDGLPKPPKAPGPKNPKAKRKGEGGLAPPT